MNKKSKSRQWYQNHTNDPYVIKAKESGYRSRSSFKLIEIQEKYNIIFQRAIVCDLGATPGGWSELAQKWVGPKGKVIACDILPLAPIDGVNFLAGDFNDTVVKDAILTAAGNSKIDVIISDMAPNTIGHQATDQMRSIALSESVLSFAIANLTLEGACLLKIFQGVGFDNLVKEFRQKFVKVIIKKPKSSRDKSKEVYLLALGLKKQVITNS